MKNILFLFLTLPGLLLCGCNVSNNDDTSSSSIVNQDFDNAKFDDETYVYDGKTHRLADVTGVPSGTSITYEGRDNQVNVGEYPATATLFKEGYNTKTLSATLSITPASFTNISFIDQTIEYDGQEHAIVCKNVPSFATVIYQNNKGTELGTYNATATISAPNYNTLTLTATLTITKATIKGVSFNNASYTYDGTEHSILISGTLPTGVTVSYQNNKRTNVGSQEAIATLSGGNYNTLTLRATLTINKAKFTGITFNDLEVEYDGDTHTIYASNVPSFANVVYENNSRTEPGTYNATATISADNYETLVLHATLLISLRKIIGISLVDEVVTYDGNSHSLLVSGTLPDGVIVTYEGNNQTEVGEYSVTATISGTGYETLILTATLTIKARIITGVTFESKTFDYDGNEHTLLVSGDIPEGVNVKYYDNTRTEKGSQDALAILSGKGYETLELSATLTISDPNEDKLVCSSENNILVSTSTYSSGVGTVVTNRGKDIEFSYSNAKVSEDDTWLTLGVGGYLYNVTPIESMTDASFTFLNGYEEFRVYYSYDEPIFDLAHSKDYKASSMGYKTPDIIYEKNPVYIKIENISDEDIVFEEMYLYIDTSIIPNLATLALLVNDSSYGTVSGAGKFLVGDSVTVKATSSSTNYIFDSWKKDGKVVSLKDEYTFVILENEVTLTANFVTKAEHQWDLDHGVRPTLDLENKTAKYGMYPKTHVISQSLINNLNSISELEDNGWYLYNDEYYAKVIATPYTWGSEYIPEFDDGVEIYSDQIYWFKVEPIEWLIRRNSYSDGYYYLLSKYLLDAHMFYSSKENRLIDGNVIYPNNYQYSDIRSWLNDEFYSKAFSLDNSCVYSVTVNNAKSTTNNTNGSYYSLNTKDNVFLPSYKELTTYDYGFSGDDSRKARTTDYSRAVGVRYMSVDSETDKYYKFYAEYWTRSPDNSIYGSAYLVSAVQQGGFIGSLASESVNDTNTAVRPAISLNLI